MRLVVADTSPLNYLVLIEQVEILPALFEKVFVPQIVRNELQHSEAPERVRRWIAEPPSWLQIVLVERDGDDDDLLQLDDGERAAILLATQIGADLLLIDDRAGVNVARSRGFAVTGTLGILDLAATRGMIRLSDAIERLKKTTFRSHPDILDALLARHSSRDKSQETPD
jgi:predicted nucleic acid-binding protein